MMTLTTDFSSMMSTSSGTVMDVFSSPMMTTNHRNEDIITNISRETLYITTDITLMRLVIVVETQTLAGIPVSAQGLTPDARSTHSSDILST